MVPEAPRYGSGGDKCSAWAIFRFSYDPLTDTCAIHDHIKACLLFSLSVYVCVCLWFSCRFCRRIKWCDTLQWTSTQVFLSSECTLHNFCHQQHLQPPHSSPYHSFANNHTHTHTHSSHEKLHKIAHFSYFHVTNGSPHVLWTIFRFDACERSTQRTMNDAQSKDGGQSIDLCMHKWLRKSSIKLN